MAQAVATTPAGDVQHGVDDGTVLTLWTRSVTADQTELLVERYNALFSNKVEVTVLPRDQALQAVAAAAGADDLPDLLGGNVIDGANYSSLGLWHDLTDRINALPFRDALAPAHLRVGTWEDRLYAVPHVVDVSAIYYNKILFERAGLDPGSPPTTLEGWRDAAAAISELGPEYDGMYFPGNCAGCLVFITWPSIWAADGTVLNEDGTAATLDTDIARDVYTWYNDMFHSGLMRPESQDEPGATQNEIWGSGTVGFMLLGSKALGQVPASDVLEPGVAPIPGLTGGVSTFVGGDVMGISTSSEEIDAAWHFLAWTLSEEAQLEIYARNLFMPVRTDLAENEYHAGDERLITFNQLVDQGETPYAPNFFQCFNDPVGPWLTTARGAIFGQDVDGALSQGNQELTACLSAPR
jgi:multiple sugar transport system substrate-binding protein